MAGIVLLHSVPSKPTNPTFTFIEQSRRVFIIRKLF
jgi:hypothetical protein